MRQISTRGRFIIAELGVYINILISLKDDYRRAILDTDEKQFLNVRLVVMEMRNHYAALHDILTKNLEKIKRPRNNQTELMY